MLNLFDDLKGVRENQTSSRSHEREREGEANQVGFTQIWCCLLR